MSYKVKPLNTYYNDWNTNEDKCILGISVESPFILGKHVKRVLNWIDSNFNECIILIGDDVNRYNDYLYGLSEKESEIKCTQLGSCTEAILLEALNHTNSKNFKISHWNNYTQKTSFFNHKIFLEEQYNQNEVFKNSLLYCSKRYLKKQNEIGNYYITNEEDAIKHSKNYIIEEMAVFSVLFELGFSTLIYPGTILQIFKDIINEKIINFESILEKGKYIELSIKKN